METVEKDRKVEEAVGMRERLIRVLRVLVDFDLCRGYYDVKRVNLTQQASQNS